MNGAHVTGGAIGTLLGAIVAPLLARYGVHVTDSTASLIGVAAVAFGVGLGHVVSSEGIWPAIKRVFVGPEKPVKATGASAQVIKPVVAPVAPEGATEPPAA